MAIERIVLICGDRNWKAPGPIDALCATFPGDGRTIVITGGAPGADTLGGAMAVKHGHRSFQVPAPWAKYGKLAGPLRNRWMLELMRDLALHHPSAYCEVHAFHEHIASSKGTADMIKRVRETSIPMKLHSDPEEHAEVHGADHG